MNRCIVNVYVPICEKSYDMVISADAMIYDVLPLIISCVEKLSGNLFRANKDTTLCLGDSGDILNINYSAYEQGVRNGTKLLLI